METKPVKILNITEVVQIRNYNDIDYKNFKEKRNLNAVPVGDMIKTMVKIDIRKMQLHLKIKN
jgi:hypothetical protein